MTTQPPPEDLIWKGSPSQIIQFWFLAGCLVAAAALGIGMAFVWPPGSALAVIPLVFALARWISVRCRQYEITTERIKRTMGVFSRRTDELELYRVRDTSLQEPLWYRIFGRGNILLNTTDSSTPTLLLECIPAAGETRERLRAAIESCRDRKRVRYAELGGEIETENPPPG